MMESEDTNLEAPNWLKELEAKREKRVKAKLGHETGAGAKCLVCDEKCPGLDLHFWRKTCKNCKCTKEEHDVHDDDIHGWAEWQLLGSKPNKIKTKITLPGRKDVLELDWTPKGNQETVENFLKSQPIEAIPVKGSKAAQERKQLLQKQIPIHDIDPSLCHDLTAEEYDAMNKYIAHIKEKSVGVGHLVNIGNVVRGVVHNMAPAQYQILLDKYGKNIPLFEIVKMQDFGVCKGLEKLNLGKNYTPKTTNTVNDNQMGVNFDVFKDKMYSVGQENDNANILTPKYTSDNLKTGLPHPNVQNPQNMNAGLPNYAPQNQNTLPSLQNPQNVNFRDLHANMNAALPNYAPQNQNTLPSLQNPQHVNFRDLHANMNAALPNYAPQSQNTLPSLQNPQNVNFRDLHARLPNYAPQNQNTLPSLQNPQNVNFRDLQANMNAGLPNYAPENQNTLPSVQNPQNVNFRDIHAGLPNYAPQNQNTLPSLQNPQNVNFRDLQANLNAGLPSYAPENQNTLPSLQNPQNANFRDIQANLNAGLPSYAPQNQNTLPSLHNTLLPENQKSIGNIKDLAYSTYENHNQKIPKNKMAAVEPIRPNEEYLYPENIQVGGILDVKMATLGENENYIDIPLPTEGEQVIIGDVVLPNCHHCKQLFDLNEFAVAIERSDFLFHASCFKCAGCNQILADNMYFYHKESNNIYCLRDYAKIKGYPRCKGCDELIFTKEYCLTEENTFHLKHFCCINCDIPLAGKNYLLENSHPICLPCYEKNNANKCQGCHNIIKPNEKGLLLKDKHFHVNNDCFCCVKCRKPLLNQKLLFRNDKLYCSHDCFQNV